jgi:predicted acylesterase/phospholipase RssA
MNTKLKAFINDLSGIVGFAALIAFVFFRDRWNWIRLAEGYLIGLIEASGYLLIVFIFVAWVWKGWSRKWSLRAILVTGGLLFWLVPKDNYFRDVLIIVGGASLGLVLGECLFGVVPIAERDGWSFLARFRRRTLYVAFLSAWLSVSFIDWVFRNEITLNSDRFRTLKKSSKFDDVRVGLCLSGGGYRAALLHSGVVAQLEKLEIPIHCISSVSGGSIFAAFYESGGAPEEFLNAVIQRRFNLKRRLLLFQNLMRLPAPLEMPWSGTRILGKLDFNRRDLQEEMLDQLFLDKRKLGEESSTAPLSPDWVICTTDINHGWQVGFTKDKIFMLGLKLTQAGSLLDEAHPNGISVSRAVSLSGGFPGAFPAWPARLVVDGSHGISANPRDVLLADGGIIDNLGIKLLVGLRSHQKKTSLKSNSNWNVNLIIVSNGGEMLGGQHKAGNLSDVRRSYDISSGLEASRAEEERRHFINREDLDEVCFLSPGLLADPADLALSNLNTDDENGYRQMSALLQDLLIIPYSLRANFGPGDESCASESVISELCGIFPDSKKAHQIFDEYRATPVPPDREFPLMTAPRKPLSELMKLEHPKGVVAGRLVQLFVNDINECLVAFQRTSTLVDCVPADDAKRIHRLGRYLVVLNETKLLAKAASAKERRGKVEDHSPPSTTTSTTTGK